jgi:hypothetical protein
MKKRTICIFVCILLIAVPVLSVAGIINGSKTINIENSILGDERLEPQSSQQYGHRTDSDWDYWSSPPHMYAIQSGNVGIGTTSPSAKLDVEVSSGGAATIGSSFNVALGNYAVAMGYGVNASSNYSTAMGKYTTASGLTSTAMGWGTTASGSCSTAMGEDTTASGSFSTAMGRRITVNGDYSVGIGLNTTQYTVMSDNVMSIMGGNVGIGTTTPGYLLDVYGSNGIVAQFSGRVKGADAINDDEFVTKGQVENRLSTFYTPTGTNDPNGDVGDTAWDSDYFYVKTNDGWKRAVLETWSATEE